MRAWVIVIAVGLAAMPRVAFAQGADGDVCTPACRSGYLCNKGTCISACNPVCGDTELCTGTGQCVSKCNPLCGGNEACGADGQCHATLTTTPPTNPFGAQQPMLPTPGDEGWASTAGKVGVGTAIAVAAVVAAIIVVDDADFSVPVGSVATVAGGIVVPVVARGAASARTRPGAVGMPGLRLTSWIFYGLSIADAVTLIGLTAGGADIPAGVTASVGVLGTTSIIFMSLDAFESAKQAREPGPLFQLATSGRPYIGAVRDAHHNTVATAGLAWSF